MKDLQTTQSESANIAENTGLNEIAEVSSKLGLEIVDIAGFLDLVDEASQDQMRSLTDLRSNVNEVTTSNEQVVETIQTVSQTAKDTLEAVNLSVANVRENGTHSHKVAGWVQELNSRTRSLEETVQAMLKDNATITSIANQVNILAINAKIEAGRAGQAGKGFAVVAEAINDLSKRTQKTAAEINSNITTLGEWLSQLNKEAETVGATAAHVLENAQTIDESLQDIESKAQTVQDETTRIFEDARRSQHAMSRFEGGLKRIESASQDSTSGIRTARGRVETLVSSSRSLVQGSVALGGVSSDGRLIGYVQNLAQQIGDMFEAAIKQNTISANALFNYTYQPIPNSNPQQVVTQFTSLTDRLLPPLLEAALEFDPRVVFCAAIDVNGYIPTHNKKFSLPQGPDPVWNTANCRNRRIFDDRVGLKAGRNQQAFLMQVYRRDMGGGQFVMMKDLSAPVHVNGRHWGGLRMGIKP